MCINAQHKLCRKTYLIHSPPKCWGQMAHLRDAASLVSALEPVSELQELLGGRGREDPAWVGSPVMETS